MKNLCKIFHALSDETRLKIIKLISTEELCVCEIITALNMVQPKVSFHLSVLKEANLVRTKKIGKWIIYRLNDSDLFNRFLLFSIVEKISREEIKEELERLEKYKIQKSFLYSKKITLGEKE